MTLRNNFLNKNDHAWNMKGLKDWKTFNLEDFNKINKIKSNFDTLKILK